MARDPGHTIHLPSALVKRANVDMGAAVEVFKRAIINPLPILVRPHDQSSFPIVGVTVDEECPRH